jgi:hypothetical protein
MTLTRPLSGVSWNGPGTEIREYLPSLVNIIEGNDGQAQVDSMRGVISVCATVALAACAAQQPAVDYAAAADRLDRARAEIAPPHGATTYTLDRHRLLDQPGDENRSLAESLTQLSGVTLGPNGQVHVRGQ